MEHLKTFETYLDRITALHGPQGLIVGVFDTEEILFERIIGYRDVEKRLPIDRETLFGIASITKSFTTLGLLKAVEAGRIDLDEPISTYFPKLTLAPDHMPRVRHLLSHTAGFFPQERFLMNDFAKRLGIKGSLAHSDRLAQAGIDALIERLNRQTRFTGEPGARMSYSNYSFGLVTDLVRRFSGHDDYVRAIESDVIGPLGLTRTYFDFARPAREENVSRLYTQGPEGPVATDDFTDLGFVLLGGGALKSTFNDMMRYTRMFLGATSPPLPMAWLDEMTTPRVSTRKGLGYGYALTTGDLGDLRYAGHSGGLTGVSSFFGFSRASGLGVVVLCNTGGVPASSIGIAALRLAHGLYPDPILRHEPVGTWSDAVIRNSLGEYASEEGDRMTLIRRGDEVLIEMDSETFPCLIVDEDALIILNRMEEQYCRLLRNPDGHAWGITRGSRILPRTSVRS